MVVEGCNWTEDIESKLQEALNKDNERRLNTFCEKLTELREMLSRVDYRHDRGDTNGEA